MSSASATGLALHNYLERDGSSRAELGGPCTTMSSADLVFPSPLNHGQLTHMAVSVVAWAFVFLLHVCGASLLAVFLAIRVRWEDLSALSSLRLRQISTPRLLLVLLYFMSWIFFALTGVIEQGIGLFVSHAACATGVYSCISLYSMCKLLVYLFLSERVHIVWCPTLLTPRYKSPVYILCMCTVLAYVAVICHIFIVTAFQLTSVGECFVGMRLDGAILLVAYDALASVVLTSLFVWPLWRHKFQNPQLKRTAWRSVIAAFVTLTTSCVNISILAALGGLERGWIFVACWEADLLIGASALFWATSGSGLRPLASVLDSAKHYEETHTRHRKMWFLSEKLDIVPSFVRPDLSRQVSLPTILTHGLATFDEHSEAASISTAPRSLSIQRHPVWPSLLASQHLDNTEKPLVSGHDSCAVDMHKEDETYEGCTLSFHDCRHPDCDTKSSR